MDVVFTDLDGTLLDPDDYSYEESIEGVRKLQNSNVPIVFCSSKTKAEQEFYRAEMGIDDPFIVEDGSAVIIPKGYFASKTPMKSEESGDYDVVVLGADYGHVSKVSLLLEIRCDAKAFRTMSVDEIAGISDLTPDLAALAKDRQYSETLLLGEEDLQKAKRIVEEKGLTITHGGRFHTIRGRTSKGAAAKILLDMYNEEHDNVRSIGIGDSQNDLSLLDAVDVPFLVGKGKKDFDTSQFARIDGFVDVVDEILD